MSNASAWQEARLAAVLAELDEASARAEALGEEADELQRRLADGRAGEELTDNERFESGSESDSESEEPELPKRLDEQDGDEEGAPVLPYFSDADRALEAQLSAELGVDVSALCDRVVAHIRPTEHWLCFDARAYVRTLAAAVLRSRRVRDNGFVYPPEMDNLVCGGVTQMGKTMFVVVAVVVAYFICLPCVIITTTLQGRVNLLAKVKDKLERMEAANVAAPKISATCAAASSVHGDNAMRSLLNALGGSSNPEHVNRGALFTSDTAKQLYDITNGLERLRLEKRGNPDFPCHGQFLLLLDEADASKLLDADEHKLFKMQRRLATLMGGRQDATGRWRKLGDDEHDTKKSVLEDDSFWGPQACVSISSTLLPVFMRVHREAQRVERAAIDAGVEPPKQAALYPFYMTQRMDDYVGVLSKLWLPFMMTGKDGERHETFLPERALDHANMGIDSGGLVMALYADAVAKKRSLLLDVTVSRVHTKKYNIFNKAQTMQANFPTLAVLVVHGSGSSIFLPRFRPDGKTPLQSGGEEIKVPKSRCPLDVSGLLTLMEEGGSIPMLRKRKGGEAGGDEEPETPLGRLPRLCDLPFAVIIGYGMMLRGGSVRSNFRVPTHMVNHLSAAMSVDQLVQSVGLATFQGRRFLEHNGFDRVSVLMLKMDYLTVRAYVALMAELKHRLVDQKLSLSQCFDANAAPYPEELCILVSDAQRRNIGNRREHLLLDPRLFEGHDAREEAAAELAAAKAEARAARLAEAEKVARQRAEKTAAKVADREMKRIAKLEHKVAAKAREAADDVDRKRKRAEAASPTLQPEAMDAQQLPLVDVDALPSTEVVLTPDGGPVTLHVNCSAGAAWLDLPAGAVAEPTRVCLAVRPASFEGDALTHGPLVALLPHGLVLHKPAALRISFAAVDADAKPLVLLHHPGVVAGAATAQPGAAAVTRLLFTQSKLDADVQSFDSHDGRVPTTVLQCTLDRFCLKVVAKAVAALGAFLSVKLKRYQGPALSAISASEIASGAPPSSLRQSDSSTPAAAAEASAGAAAGRDRKLSDTDSVMSSLASRRLKYDVVLSYRVPDTGHTGEPRGDGTARKLKDMLTSRGFRTFLGEQDLEPATLWPEELQEALDDAAALVVLCSRTYDQSKWAKRELYYADSLDKVLVPVWHSGNYPPGRGVGVIISAAQRVPLNVKTGFGAAGAPSKQYLEEVADQTARALQQIAVRRVVAGDV